MTSAINGLGSSESLQVPLGETVVEFGGEIERLRAWNWVDSDSVPSSRAPGQQLAPDVVREVILTAMGQKTILKVLAVEGELTRGELAGLLDIDASEVEWLATQLVYAGLVHEAGAGALALMTLPPLA